MKIISAEFLTGAVSCRQYPDYGCPELAFVGRSNVGKSSLINSLLNRKKLVKTSQTPGKTQEINFFKINNDFIFADLPGYGFAKFSEELKLRLYKLIKNYIERRKFLKNIFLLIDGKIGIKENDLETILFLVNRNISFTIILTKTDKCSKIKLNENKKEILNLLNNYSSSYFKIFPTSSINNEGIADVQKNIFNLTK